MNQSHSTGLAERVIITSRCDRWQIYQRLQELSIACGCLADGGLWVDLPSAVAVLQLHSVLQQYSASRGELVDWLQRCWRVES